MKRLEDWPLWLLMVLAASLLFMLVLLSSIFNAWHVGLGNWLLGR